MRLGILGTGDVGRTLASAFAALGHHVILGSRTADNEAGATWARDAGEPAGSGTFAAAAHHGEVLVHAVGGTHALAALATIAPADLAGKVLVDVSNPLDFSAGFPPSVVQPEGRSLGEAIQAAYPGARVVKTLNTVTASVMVDPSSVAGDHAVFTAGDDADARGVVRGLLVQLGWRPVQIIDLGELSAARATEQYLPLWLALMQTLGTAQFGIEVRRAP